MNSTPVRPPRLTREESQRETRRRLVASAIELFARQGVAATSLHAVAEHAGFSRGAVHGNYAGKDDLAAAVAETVVSELAPTLSRILAERAPSGERLATYIRTYLEYCARNPDAAGALLAVVEYFGRRDRGYYRDRATDSLDELVTLFEEGGQSGEMRVFDTRTMAFAVRTVLDSAAMRLSAGQVDAERLTTEIVALFAAATRRDGASA
ncbi:TetR/AcrR family transcriptional regulator [Nocardia puris]|uniref:TetR family transcriptional regulator n=1 Tax=Nocardia puris TaxID=208602 RepID=A0A366E1Y0_9NOCA|nr:TetR/AcrR family transcriptional regulator [Nocardia puris]MBF6212803.1 TetR/AcrR family transcriptional regulator [Nocardia puris]MBF6367738.1 TetR/AcrR family transcriptional regulator [Nocardia puris]MBF6461389.1 TetR/AcrR family transcriptional regulator [Nocardia puris]RBO96371.1 TetR family transcriptional regulator [Nocardia puris]